MNTRRSFLGAVLGSAALVTLASVAGTAAAEGTKDTSRRPGEYIDDKTVETKVKSALIGKDEVKARNIEVEVRDGMVTLAGTVGSAAEAEAAVATARKVSGVKSVNSTLTVKP